MAALNEGASGVGSVVRSVVGSGVGSCFGGFRSSHFFLSRDKGCNVTVVVSIVTVCVCVTMRVSENKSSTVDILSDWVILVCGTPERSIEIGSLDALTGGTGLAWGP